MGSGIVHVCALAGYDVLIHDVSTERIQSGLATITGNLARQQSKGHITEEARKAALGHIRAAENLDNLADADLVIESGDRERAGQAQDLRPGLAAAEAEAMLATNTSSISITRLAASTDRPERFIGIHFMNPVPVMELVELVRGIATGDETFEEAKAFVAKLGKTVSVRR